MIKNSRKTLPNLVGLVGSLGLTVAITFLGLMALTFFIGRVVPIDPVAAIVGAKAPKEVYDRVFHEMGMDKPVIAQFAEYLWRTLRGDFGTSFVTTRPVLTDIVAFFPATFELATIGLVLGVITGVPAGVMSAYHHDTWVDHLIRVIGLIGYSGPGRLDIYYDGIVPPVTGLILVDSLLAGEQDVFWNAVGHITLPAILLGYYSLAYISRMTRSVMLEQLSQEYVLTARVKGASEFRVVICHALRNAAIPLVTIVALSYGGLLEGSVLIESVFSWPGIGNYIASSLFSADMNAVLGGTILVGAIFVFLNLLSDVLYRALDPRSQ